MLFHGFGRVNTQFICNIAKKNIKSLYNNIKVKGQSLKKLNVKKLIPQKNKGISMKIR